MTNYCMAKVGDRIKIIYMDGEPQYTNKEGVVTLIDDLGGIHGTWGGCAILGGDVYEILEEKNGKKDC